MKILRIIHSANPRGGGPINGIQMSSPLLIKRGCDITHVCLNAPRQGMEGDPSVKWIALGPATTGFGYTRKLDHWLAEHITSFDAVIVHGMWQYHGFAVWRACRKLGPSAPPYFVFTHGMLDPWFKRTYPLKHLKKWLYWPWGEYRVLRDARAVLFTCEEERRLARQSFWLYRANERVIRYGTVRPDYAEESAQTAWANRLPELQGRPFWLFLGRLQEKKGVDQLIEAYRALDPEIQPELVIAGPEQDPAYATRLRKLAGGDPRIHFVGMISGETKWGALLAADALVLPSHQENFGIVVAEALAAGTPALITRPVNIWREVESHGAGLVEEDTLDGVCRLLRRFLSLTPDDQQAMATRARRCFDRCFDLRNTAEDLIKLFHETQK